MSDAFRYFQNFFDGAFRFNIDTAEKDFAGKNRDVHVVNAADPEGFKKYQLLIKVGPWRFSAIWGTGSYCSGARPNGNWDFGEDAPSISPDAEVALYFHESMLEIGGERVHGWVKPEELEKAIQIVESGNEPLAELTKLFDDT